MAADENVPIVVSENDLPGAKLKKGVENLTKTEAIMWLKYRGCRNLSQLKVNELRDKYVLSYLIFDIADYFSAFVL